MPALKKGKKGKRPGKSSNVPPKSPKRSGPGWTLVSVPGTSASEEEPEEPLPQAANEIQAAQPSRPRPRPRPKGKSQAPNEEDQDEDTFVIRRSTGVSNPAIPPAGDAPPGVSQSPAPSPPVAPEPPAALAPTKVVLPAPVSLFTATDSTTAAAEPSAALDPRSLFDDPNLLTMPELPAEREPSLPPSNQLALRISRPRTPDPAPRTPTRESDPRPRDTLDDADLLPFAALGMPTPAPSKPGPIPAAVQEEAFAIHAEYQRLIEALAKTAGKAPEAFYALLGSGSHLSRVPIGEWTRHVARKYTEQIQELLAGRPDTPANRKEVLAPTIQWYREHFANHVVHLKSQGKMKQLVNKVVDDCLAISQSAYELYGIHVCGFAVNLDPDKSNRTHSAPWGASPEYEKMLQNHKPIIARDLQNWESHLR
ncbi:hypothetical protein H0H92_007562, partial [Tricholoma furcatifolium]